MAEQDDDDLELGDLRSVFASMRETDEDPPETGMAALMAAARAKADEMKPQPSLWERFFAAVSRPPVLAFATVVVLVGGGAVMFRHRGEMKETVNVAVPAPTGAAPALESAPAPKAPPPEEKPEPPPPATTPSATPPTAKPPPAKISPRVEILAGKKKGAMPTAKTTVATEQRLDPIDDSVNITKETQSDGPRGAKDEAPATLATAHGAVAPKAPAAPGEAEGVGGARPAAISTADLVKKWEAAAAANNCALADSLGAQLAERDRALYNRTFQSNPALQNCLKK